MAAIQTTDVSKRFGSITAVDRVDLVVEEGEIFGFLGKNGAGKSTMINIALDFIRPDSGRVEVFGHDINRESVLARAHMGVLPERYGLYDQLSGRQHVELAARSKDTTVEPMAVLERVGLCEAADRNAGGYSKGMSQRLVLAMALVGEPDRPEAPSRHEPRDGHSGGRPDDAGEQRREMDPGVDRGTDRRDSPGTIHPASRVIDCSSMSPSAAGSDPNRSGTRPTQSRVSPLKRGVAPPW